MALKVFTAPSNEAADGPKVNDIVGTFRSGKKDQNGQPMSLPDWRVTTGDPEVADALLQLYGGGTKSPFTTNGEEKIAVDLLVDKLPVLLEGNGYGLRVRFVQRGDGYKIVYTSDGETITDADGSTEPDPDAELSLKDRMAKAKKGRGPKVEMDVLFRLADDPDLGKFRFSSSSPSVIWGLFFDRTEAAYEAIIGPAWAVLAKVKETIKAGPNAGVEFTKVSLKVIGHADEYAPF